ncbi:hypothetical protein [Streptomyces sp. NPDC004134]|uniref:hypothetical protein n=1 Tax=Streptomyces sp. NPDC004134 TaxID=3364691 RepID=UPI003695D059
MTLAAAVGGHRNRDGYFEGWQVESSSIECAIADLMALVRTTAGATGNAEYEVRVRIDWNGEDPLSILTVDTFGFPYHDVSTPLRRYTPVETTVNAGEPDLDYHWQVHDLAQDCVNQGGISNLLQTGPPEPNDQV